MKKNTLKKNRKKGPKKNEKEDDSSNDEECIDDALEKILKLLDEKSFTQNEIKYSFIPNKE